MGGGRERGYRGVREKEERGTHGRSKREAQEGGGVNKTPSSLIPQLSLCTSKIIL